MADISQETLDRLLYENVRLKDDKLRLELQVADLLGVPHAQITGAVALALAHQQLATLREFARTNNPTERDLNCYVILCKLTELSCACKHLIANEVPVFCGEEE